MRLLTTLLLVAMLLAISACTSSQIKLNESDTRSKSDMTDPEPIMTKPGTYYMIVSDMEGKPEAFRPSLTLSRDKTFTFEYDFTSSYLFKGYYEIEDNIVSANVEGGAYHYLFLQVDQDTLSFMAEGSSDVSLNDQRLGIPITDGALFKIEENKEDDKIGSK